jgi:Xaa-Pro aminopeptidase
MPTRPEAPREALGNPEPARQAIAAPSDAEIARRYRQIRAALERERLDALLVCGNQYAGFEGAVRYVSGFEIVHRYSYVLLPLEGEPTLIFPREARWIGDKGTSWLRQQVWPELPGQWIREQGEARRWKRLGVYGLDAVMAVRDYRALAAGPIQLVGFDRAFDLARAVKSEEEMAAIRHSMAIIEEGFWALLEAYHPGKTEAEIMAPAVERFFAGGAGSQMMNILLSGSAGEAAAHFKVPRGRVVAPGDLLLYSLEIAGPEGYWVEFSRPLIRGPLGDQSAKMAEIYPEAVEAARLNLRAGQPVSRAHDAAAEIFLKRGFRLGHLSGHSIGMTMIEHPAIGAAVDTVLEENMVFSFHPQVVDAEGKTCLYTQDMFRVGPSEGENLSNVPWKSFSGEERPG